jgi:hypothetical protein
MSNEQFNNLFNQIMGNEQKRENLEKQIEGVKDDNHLLLEQMKDLMKDKETSSFQRDGKYYQIRCRSGKNFLVVSDKPFGRKKAEKPESKAA